MYSLEKRLEKPNKKQWLPYYGIHQIDRDREAGKPTILDKRFVLPFAYHVSSFMYLGSGITIGGAIGLYYLIKNYFI